MDKQLAKGSWQGAICSLQKIRFQNKISKNKIGVIANCSRKVRDKLQTDSWKYLKLYHT
jgi:hypothetical protein